MWYIDESRWYLGGTPVVGYKFKALVNSGVTRNHILLLIANRLGILYKEKERPYLLIII
jgi:hypothetical protein